MMLSKQQQHLLRSLCRSTKNASTPSPSIHLFRGGLHVGGNKLTSTASAAFSSSKRGRSMMKRNRLNDHTNYSRNRHDAGNAIGFQIVGTVAIVAGAVSAVAMAYCEEETGTEIEKELDSDYSYLSRPDRK